jgi:hypothetical protein
MKTRITCLMATLVLTGFSLTSFSIGDTQKVQLVQSSASQTIDSLKAELDNLRHSVQQGSYTRIPNEDFENIIDNKIQKSLRETVNWWLFVIAALVSVLGFLVNKYATAYLQTAIDTKVNQLKEENEAKIRSISNHYFSSVIDSLLDFKIETITKKNNKVEETVVNDLKSYLTDESITIAESKKVFLIDTIMRCYYYSNFTQRIEKMIDLITEYETKFTLFPSTYINAAIAFCDMYDRYGTKDFLNPGIENCNKSIRILPDYGLAFAQKLELYVMAISKAFDNAERKQYEDELQKAFKDIENNTSTYLCYELANRLESDKNSFLKPYLESLYSEYPDEIAKIKTRASDYAATLGT